MQWFQSVCLCSQGFELFCQFHIVSSDVSVYSVLPKWTPPSHMLVRDPLQLAKSPNDITYYSINHTCRIGCNICHEIGYVHCMYMHAYTYILKEKIIML